MNRHAEKLVYDDDADASARQNQLLGAFVQEVHSCAACGRTEVRRGD